MASTLRLGLALFALVCLATYAAAADPCVLPPTFGNAYVGQPQKYVLRPTFYFSLFHRSTYACRAFPQYLPPSPRPPHYEPLLHARTSL